LAIQYLLESGVWTWSWQQRKFITFIHLIICEWMWESNMVSKIAFHLVNQQNWSIICLPKFILGIYQYKSMFQGHLLHNQSNGKFNHAIVAKGNAFKKFASQISLLPVHIQIALMLFHSLLHNQLESSVPFR
jgi:hypothetical protein